MPEILERIIKEKISADHLLYVSLKYTKTCDVIINIIKRWKIMIDYSFESLLETAKKKKIIKKIPDAPKLRLDVLKQIFSKNVEVLNTIKEYEMFRLIDNLPKTKENEFRKGVCLRVLYKGSEVLINLDKLKEYFETFERFINFTKLYLAK